LRGVNTRVIVGGIIKPGDTITVIPAREENPTP
jgi:MOSC domain-containing protein YiiM